MSIQKKFFALPLLLLSLATANTCSAMQPPAQLIPPLAPAAVEADPEILPLLLQIGPGAPIDLAEAEPITHEPLAERITATQRKAPRS